MDHHIVAAVSISGISLDVLGGLYLAYDLLGGQHGPLRLLTRIVTYSIVFGVGYGLGLGLFVDRSFDSPTQHWFVVFLCGPWLRISVLPGHIMLEKLPGVVYQNNLLISITAITYGLYGCLFVARPRWSTLLWLVAMHALNLAIFARQYWY